MAFGGTPRDNQEGRTFISAFSVILILSHSHAIYSPLSNFYNKNLTYYLVLHRSYLSIVAHFFIFVNMTSGF